VSVQRPENEPDQWCKHPWLSHDVDEAVEALRMPARVCWHAREVHTNFIRLGRRRADIEERSPLAMDAVLLGDEWSQEVLRSALDTFSAIAVNNLAGMAALVWAGEQFFGTPVLARASLEASVAAMWLLEPGDIDVTAAREEVQAQWTEAAHDRAVRAHLLTYNDYARAVPAASDGATQDHPAEKRRATYLDRLERLYGSDQVKLNKRGILIKLRGMNAPTFTAMFKAVNERLDHDGVWGVYYSILSRLAHPSPGMVTDFYTVRNAYHHDPLETRRFMWVAVFGYTNYLKHAIPYAYRDPAEADRFLAEWEDQVMCGWPDFFGNSPG